MNNKNLRRLTSEEAREIGRKGGKKSAEMRKRRKTIKDFLQVLVQAEAPQGKVRTKIKEFLGADEEVTLGATLAYQMIMKAISGDARMIRLCIEILGELPQDQHKVEYDNKMLELKEREVKAREEGW